MTTELNIDAVASALSKHAYDEIPAKSASTSVYYQIMQKCPNKWVDARLMSQILEQLGVEAKYVSNNMHKLKNQPNIEVQKRGRTNFFRFNA